VGMTRAKQELHIHYNNKLFNDIRCNDVELIHDSRNYQRSDELVSQLSHKDVFLGFFEGKQEKFINLTAGMKLEIVDNGLVYNDNGRRMLVVQYSKKYRQQMQHYMYMGYNPVSAQIRFVVAWKNKDSQKTCIVVLPDITYVS
ncbi:MAG: hypothetical protein PUE71_03985, partial [Clostridia bacterium]|nr:hypothetical protein [Clostridia bacterium]